MRARVFQLIHCSVPHLLPVGLSCPSGIGTEKGCKDIPQLTSAAKGVRKKYHCWKLMNSDIM